MISRVYPHGQPIHAYVNLAAGTAAFSWFNDQGGAVTFAAKDRIVVDNGILTNGIGLSTVFDDLFAGTAGTNLLNYVTPGYGYSASNYNGYFGAGTNFQTIYNNGGGGSGFQINNPSPGLSKATGGNSQAAQWLTSIAGSYQVTLVVNPVVEAMPGIGPVGRLATSGGAATGTNAVILLYATTSNGVGSLAIYQNNTLLTTTPLAPDWTLSHTITLEVDSSKLIGYFDGVKLLTVTGNTTGNAQPYAGFVELAPATPNNAIQEFKIQTLQNGPAVIVFYDNTGTGTLVAKNIIYEGSPLGLVSFVRGNSIGFSGSINGKTPAVYYTALGSGTVLLLGRRLTT